MGPPEATAHRYDLSRLDIPKFYLWRIDSHTLANGYPDGETKTFYRKILDRKRLENEDPDPYVFEVVDGQQRIRTILEYMGVKPPGQDSSTAEIGMSNFQLSLTHRLREVDITINSMSTSSCNSDSTH